MFEKERRLTELAFDTAVNKVSAIEIVTHSGMKIKMESKIPDMCFLSGKFFKTLGIQKCFDGKNEVEISTNLSAEFAEAVLFAFGYPVFEMHTNETGNIIAIVGGE
jgi:hypothetical protein